MPASAGLASAKKGAIQSTKDQILDAALNLFTARGYDATPTSLISREAKVSTGTLFYYFPNKNSIVEQLYLSVKRDLSTYVQSKDGGDLSTRERLFSCFRGYIEWANANPKKFVFMDQFYHSANISQSVKQEAYEEFDWAKGIVKTAINESILKDLPFEFHMAMLPSIVNGLMALAESQKTELSKDQLIAAGLGMLLRD
jgi:AcrR family transcriptional regulator